jgi:hypothetical protein
MTSFPTSGSVESTATPRPTVAPSRATDLSVNHEIVVVDGRFAAAHCSCGWRSAGRRNRATVRAEARDHALLYADGRAATA